MTKILGIGNALTDVLVHIPDEKLLRELQLEKAAMSHVDEQKMHRVHEAIQPFSPQRATGGSAANTIHALAVLGIPVGFVGSVGDDETGRFFASSQQRRGIDTRLHVKEGALSGVATTLITPDGERTFATYLGAATSIQVDDLECRRGEILHVEGYLVQDHDLMEEVLRRAKAAGMLVSYDLASWNIVKNDRSFVHHLVEDYADMVFANEEEAAAFSGQDDPRVALSQLAGLTQIAVVKVGKRGAYGQCGAQVAFVPGLDRKAVDTTAAGDFFAAGFLYGYVHGDSLEASLDTGNRLAGEVVQVMGTQLSEERIRAAVGGESGLLGRG